ncbi:MAG: conjugal transfer protein TraX [Mollicutes bacterium]|nr:conjugal transfer protein TraX [Mollicutes bacterium]
MKKIELSSETIKIIAIITMIIDHIGWAFISNNSTSFFIHFIGRFTAPVMCFFIVEGYKYTKDLKLYLLRLLSFAFISQVPFALFQNSSVIFYPLNMMFSLMLSLAALYIYDKVKDKLLCYSFILCLLSISLMSDWSIYSILMALCFYKFKDNKIKIYISFLLMLISQVAFTGAWYHLGILLSLPILLNLYNGKRKNKNKFGKYVFYIIYPLHLILIDILKILL